MTVVHRHQGPGARIDQRPRARPDRRRRQAGYVVAIVIQLVGLYVVRHIVDWDVPLITDDFDRVVPYIELSILATLGANIAWLLLDPRWFRSLLQVGVNLVSLGPIVRMWQIFPFDLSADDGVWRVGLRALLVVAFAGTVVGTGAELARLARAARGSRPSGAARPS